MSADGLAFVVVCLAGVLIIGVTWQVFGIWLDRQAEHRRHRRTIERQRRWKDLS